MQEKTKHRYVYCLGGLQKPTKSHPHAAVHCIVILKQEHLAVLHQFHAGIWDRGNLVQTAVRDSASFTRPWGWNIYVFFVYLQPDISLVVGTYCMKFQDISSWRQYLQTPLGLTKTAAVWHGWWLAVPLFHIGDTQISHLVRALHHGQL